MKLHPIQVKILEGLPEVSDLDSLSLRGLARSLSVKNPQQIKHHLQQLEKKGYIRRDMRSRKLFVLKTPISDVVLIPLYGTAECGPHGFLAEDNVIDEVPVSTKTFSITDPSIFLFVTARGNSMEPRIHEDDLVLIRQQDFAEYNSLCLILHDEIPKIKILRKIDKDTVALCSYNENFSAEVINLRKTRLVVLGVVKGIISTGNVNFSSFQN